MRNNPFDPSQITKNIYLSWSDTFKTIGLLSAATLFSMGLRTLDIGEQNIIMVYILSVFIISRITRGYVYGIVGSALSVLLFNFFFTSPYYTFHVMQADYPVTFLIMLIVASLTSALTIRAQSQALLVLEREHRTELLYEISKELLVTRKLESIIHLINQYMIKLFERSAIFYTQNPEISEGTLKQSPVDCDASFMLSENERTVAQWVFLHKADAGVGTNTSMGSKAFYMPVISQGKVLGVIGLSCAKGELSSNSRSLLQVITSQVALALERQHLSDEQRKILVESEKEKMRSNLLRAISHDLRTPLTAILGASSAILENRESLDERTQYQLLSNIKEDSQWLIRMVENLLSVTRIKEGTLNVAKTSEAAEEIIAEAVSRIRKRFPQQKIRVDVPDELLLVPMDGTLIKQVMINLIENAIKHSPENTAIEIKVKKLEREAMFEVIDYGTGIEERNLPYLFESGVPNEKRSADSARGMGIGLSICMSIVKAHHGKMEAANKKTGGAILRFTLPLEGTDVEQ
ncbi:histidine kinase [Desulfitobacterium dehalogenans ATCC 51507]|uniref:histidine kinase n=1 Tax=Desulfitobacterium dehalogenans (strain ATCC 51507 / DSM 9161 / JW/IU-DC1) TaxID=756499 RepID=I4AE42_DESDJ|nr:DUF4118 domain-containing protein [Desulfitobacterium dehalogenans]AFM02227.1 histidine kinase [Desulfitobacterium dehalogenans ATCC 51507]